MEPSTPLDRASNDQAAPHGSAPWRLATPPLVVEHTHWSWGLVGFYVSCAGVALGATIAAAGYWFFGSTLALWLGIPLSAGSCVTTYLTLRAARQPKSGQSPARE